MILSQFGIHVYHKLSSLPPPYGFTTPALGVGHSPARGCESIKFSEKKEVAEAAANKIEPLLICDLFFMEGLQMKHLDHVTLVNGLSEIYQLFTLLYPEMVQQVKEWYQYPFLFQICRSKHGVLILLKCNDVTCLITQISYLSEHYKYKD